MNLQFGHVRIPIKESKKLKRLLQLFYLKNRNNGIEMPLLIGVRRKQAPEEMSKYFFLTYTGCP